MKAFAVAIFAFLGILIGAAVLLGLGFLGFSNTANKYEIDIKAQYSENQNVYDNGFKKVVEIAQVPQMETDALKSLYDGTMKGRYGADGSKAILQFIKEQNPGIDQEAFRKIQQTIEIFRNEFQANQKSLISHKQEYETFLNATTSGRLYNFIGHYPHIDMSVYDIMTSDQTDHDFKTKRGAAINLRTGNVTTTGNGSAAISGSGNSVTIRQESSGPNSPNISGNQGNVTITNQ